MSAGSVVKSLLRDVLLALDHPLPTPENNDLPMTETQTTALLDVHMPEEALGEPPCTPVPRLLLQHLKAE